jgi:hypothetical protein
MESFSPLEFLGIYRVWKTFISFSIMGCSSFWGSMKFCVVVSLKNEGVGVFYG